MHGTPTDGTIERWLATQKRIAGFAALAFFADGMGTQAMGLALPALVKAWEVPRAALATATATGLVGFAAGAFLGGLFGDRFGRHATLVGSLLLLGAATAACGITHSPAELGLVRIFAGLGLGASLPCAAALIVEATPRRHHSIAIAIGLSFLPLGGFLEGLGAVLVLPAHGWSGLFIATGTVALLLGVAMALYSPATRAAGPPGATSVPRATAHVPFRTSLATLLSPPMRRDTLGLWGAFFFTVLIYYSIFSWLPTAFSGQGTGVAVASGAISAFAVGGLGGGLLAGWLSHRYGSRPTLWILCVGGAIMGALLALLSSSASADPRRLILAVGMLGATIIGLQTALYALGAHVYESTLRSSGIGVAVGWGRIGAIASSFTGVVTLDHGGALGYFSFIAAAALLALGSGLVVTSQIDGTRNHDVAHGEAAKL